MTGRALVARVKEGIEVSRRTTTFSRIIRAGMLNFVRNAWLAIAAMAIMVVTLTIILFSIIANATFDNTVRDITGKINISVYLKDSVKPAQAKSFVDGLRALDSVESVKYLDKNAALKAYLRQNAGNTQLLAAINETDNPLPATIQIKPKELNRLAEIRKYIEQPKLAALQSDAASDNGDRRKAIDNITHATNI